MSRRDSYASRTSRMSHSRVESSYRSSSQEKSQTNFNQFNQNRPNTAFSRVSRRSNHTDFSIATDEFADADGTECRKCTKNQRVEEENFKKINLPGKKIDGLSDLVRLNNGVLMPKIFHGIWIPTNKGASSQVDVLGLMRSITRQENLIGIDTAYRWQKEGQIGTALNKVFCESLVKSVNDESRWVREKLFISGKLWCTYHGGEKSVEECIDRSLAKLGFDKKEQYFDLYYVHYPCSLQASKNDIFPFWPNPNEEAKIKFLKADYDADLLTVWRKMEKLYMSGKIRALGLSFVNINQLRYLVKNCYIKPQVIQIEYHPYLRESEIYKFCQEKNIHIQGHGPLFWCFNKPVKQDDSSGMALDADAAADIEAAKRFDPNIDSTGYNEGVFSRPGSGPNMSRSKKRAKSNLGRNYDPQGRPLTYHDMVAVRQGSGETAKVRPHSASVAYQEQLSRGRKMKDADENNNNDEMKDDKNKIQDQDNISEYELPPRPQTAITKFTISPDSRLIEPKRSSKKFWQNFEAEHISKYVNGTNCFGLDETTMEDLLHLHDKMTGQFRAAYTAIIERGQKLSKILDSAADVKKMYELLEKFKPQDLLATMMVFRDPFEDLKSMTQMTKDRNLIDIVKKYKLNFKQSFTISEACALAVFFWMQYKDVSIVLNFSDYKKFETFMSQYNKHKEKMRIIGEEVDQHVQNPYRFEPNSDREESSYFSGRYFKALEFSTHDHYPYQREFRLEVTNAVVRNLQQKYKKIKASEDPPDLNPQHAVQFARKRTPSYMNPNANFVNEELQQQVKEFKKVNQDDYKNAVHLVTTQKMLTEVKINDHTHEKKMERIAENEKAGNKNSSEDRDSRSNIGANNLNHSYNTSYRRDSSHDSRGYGSSDGGI